LIAEKVMGWRVRSASLPEVFIDGQGYPRTTLEGLTAPGFFPSTNIAFAWEVVERLRSLGHEVIIQSWQGRAELGEWCVIIEMASGHDTGQIVADTALLAICLAALKAVGGT